MYTLVVRVLIFLSFLPPFYSVKRSESHRSHNICYTRNSARLDSSSPSAGPQKNQDVCIRFCWFYDCDNGTPGSVPQNTQVRRLPFVVLTHHHTTFISIYTLTDLGDLSNLIGSLSRTIQQHLPPSEWIMCELDFFPMILENELLKVARILGSTFF